MRGTTTIKRTIYSAAGQPLATRVVGDPSNSGLFYLTNDHLGSSVMLVNSTGGEVAGSTTRYQPFGAYRGAMPTQGVTELGYTGHRENMELGLIYMNARYYVPGLGRFASADTIVPDPTNPQQFNRFSYVLNNPTRFTDPSGHICYDPSAGAGAGSCFDGDGTPLPTSQPTPQVPKRHRGTGSSVVMGFNLSNDDLLILTLGVFAENQNASHPAFARELWVWVFLNKQARSRTRSMYEIINSSSGAWNDPNFVRPHAVFRGEPPINAEGHRTWLLGAANAYMNGSSTNARNFQALYAQIVGADGIYDSWRLHGTNSDADPTYGAEFAVHRDPDRFASELGPLFADYAKTNTAFSYVFSAPYLGTMTVVGNHACIYDHRECH